MGIQYHRWPFLPITSLTGEQAAIWWDACYVPLPAMQTMQKEASAVAVVGSAGSGKSTAVVWFKQSLPPDAFLVHYDVAHWQSIVQLGVTDGKCTLLERIMTVACIQMMQHLSDDPQKADALHQNPFAAEFLSWLLNKHLDRRTFLRFRHRITQALNTSELLPDSTTDLYPTYTGATLGELVETAQILGFTKLVIVLDLAEHEADQGLDDLVKMFSIIPLMEQKGLVIRAALSQNSIEKGNLLSCSGGRLQAANLYFDEEFCRSIVNKHLLVATDGQFDQLGMLAETAVIQRAHAEIQNLYNSQTIAGWLHWAETLLAIYDQKPVSDPNEAAYHFYLRHVPLRLDRNRHGVWRGPQFILIDERQFDLLKLLFELDGKPSPDRLIHEANDSSPYLNTLASRLRKVLEPVEDHQIYLKHSRPIGYWLENFTR